MIGVKNMKDEGMKGRLNREYSTIAAADRPPSSVYAVQCSVPFRFCAFFGVLCRAVCRSQVGLASRDPGIFSLVLISTCSQFRQMEVQVV